MSALDLLFGEYALLRLAIGMAVCAIAFLVVWVALAVERSPGRHRSHMVAEPVPGHMPRHAKSRSLRGLIGASS